MHGAGECRIYTGDLAAAKTHGTPYIVDRHGSLLARQSLVVSPQSPSARFSSDDEAELVVEIVALVVDCYGGDKRRVFLTGLSMDKVVSSRVDCGWLRHLRHRRPFGHASWYAAYNSEELYSWFLQHRRKDVSSSSSWIIKLFPRVLTSLPPYTTAFPTDSSQLLHTMTTPINSDKKGNEP